MSRKRYLLVALLVLGATSLPGCGDDASSSSDVDDALAGLTTSQPGEETEDVGETESDLDPAAETVATPSSSGDAEDARGFVNDYFGLLDDRRFEEAWGRLSPSVQGSFGGFTAWSSGYEETSSTSVRDISITGVNGGVASMQVSITGASRCSGEGRHLENFSGSWMVQLEPLQITGAAFEPTGSDPASEC